MVTVSPQIQEDDDGLTEDDWDVVCQFFWLPHSHGPMVERLLEDFRSCLFNIELGNLAIRTSKIAGVKIWIERVKVCTVQPTSYIAPIQVVPRHCSRSARLAKINSWRAGRHCRHLD